MANANVKKTRKAASDSGHSSHSGHSHSSSHSHHSSKDKDGHHSSKDKDGHHSKDDRHSSHGHSSSSKKEKEKEKSSSNTSAKKTSLNRPVSHIGLHFNERQYSLQNLAYILRSKLAAILHTIGYPVILIKDAVRAALARLSKVLGDSKKWMIKNPGRIIVLGLSTATMFATGIIVGPALRVLGFTNAGIKAGMCIFTFSLNRSHNYSFTMQAPSLPSFRP
jgi:hypothetical protein